uniref:Uncharacterized protein n=1 Tax=Lepeophtheirus salmonis TaxID=72036 RepID=A0A0K2U8I8_LEPSM
MYTILEETVITNTEKQTPLVISLNNFETNFVQDNRYSLCKIHPYSIHSD